MINSIKNNSSFGNKKREHNIDRLVFPTALAATGAGIAIKQRKEISRTQILSLNEKFADIFVANPQTQSKKEQNATAEINNTIKSNKTRKMVVEHLTNKEFKDAKTKHIEDILGTSIKDFRKKFKEDKLILNSLKLNYEQAKKSSKDERLIDELERIYLNKKQEIKRSKIKSILITRANKKGHVSRKTYKEVLTEFATLPLKTALKTLRGKLPKIISLPKVALFAGIGAIGGSFLNKFIGFDR